MMKMKMWNPKEKVEKKKIKEASKALKSIIELIEKGELDSTVLPELNTLVNKINIEKWRCKTKKKE